MDHKFANMKFQSDDDDDDTPPTYGSFGGGPVGAGGNSGMTAIATSSGGAYTSVPMRSHHPRHVPLSSPRRDSDPDASGSGSGMEYLNLLLTVILAFIFIIYIISTHLESSTPAVLDVPPRSTTSDPPLPPPPPPPPPPPARTALVGPPPPPPRPAVPGLDFLFFFTHGHQLALPGAPAAAEGAGPPPTPRARTFYLVESDGASAGSVQAMDRLRPEDLAHYQCCCYDEHVSVCQSASGDLLPGYELACLLLYDSDDGPTAGGRDGAWTLVVTLGDRYARDTYCRLGVEPLASDRRPDRRTHERLFVTGRHEKRTLPEPTIVDDEQEETTNS